MKVHFIDRDGLLTSPMQQMTESRLLFALARFGLRIQRVTATFESCTDARRTGLGCLVEVLLRGADDVVVRDEDTNLQSCIVRAAERVGRAVARSIDRAAPGLRDFRTTAIQ